MTSETARFSDTHPPGSDAFTSELPLDPTWIEHYRAQGYAKLKVFETSDLTNVAASIRACVDAHTGAQEAVAWHERSTYQKAFVQVMNLWRKSEAVKSLVFSKRLARIAAELMGTDGVRLYHDQALFKEPAKRDVGGHTPWHVDQYYWPLDTDRTVTAWIPLQAVPEAMGPLTFAAGSQRFKQGRDLSISDESERALSDAIDEAGFKTSAEPYASGEVSFHSGWTFHRAGANRSKNTREVMTVIYMDHRARVAEAANANQKLDQETWIPGITVGEVAASELNPVLWSRSTS